MGLKKVAAFSHLLNSHMPVWWDPAVHDL